jgi:aspartate racemase
MKTIGLVGGMSWESSKEYYHLINKLVKEKLGGLHSAKSVMYSFDFADLEETQRSSNWDQATTLMVYAAKRVEAAGADFILLCSNTGHEGADIVQQKIGIPLLHIADVTGEEIKALGLNKVGLLGTKYTMTKDYIKGRIEKKFGINVIVPKKEDIEVINKIIYEELCQGIIKDESREKYKIIMNKLVLEGAQGIILGCTEIPLLVNSDDCSVPIFDTTLIHAKVAVELALK